MAEKSALEKFVDAVELMSNDEIQAQIDARMKLVNSYTMSADDERKHVRVLRDRYNSRMLR